MKIKKFDNFNTEKYPLKITHRSKIRKNEKGVYILFNFLINNDILYSKKIYFNSVGDVISVDDFDVIDGYVVENPINMESVKNIGNELIKTYKNYKIKKTEEIKKLKLTVDNIDFNIIEYNDGKILLEASYKGKILFYISDDMVDSDDRIDKYKPEGIIELWKNGENFKDGVFAHFKDLDISKLEKF